MVKSRLDPPKPWFFVSSALLVFAYDVAVGVYEIFPFDILKFGVDSFQQVRQEGWGILSAPLGTRPEAYLKPARYEGDGVTRIMEGQTTPGLTFLSGFFENTNEMRLIEQDGSVVNRWPVQFSKIFPDLRHIKPADRIPSTD